MKNIIIYPPDLFSTWVSTCTAHCTHTEICTALTLSHFYTNTNGSILFSLCANAVLRMSWIASICAYWWRVFFRLLINLWTSLATVYRSRWRSLFLTYHGTSTIFLRILFWNLSTIRIFYGLVQPHNFVPYAYIRVSNNLHHRNLL